MGKSKELYVGIDAGSVSVNCVVIDQNKRILYEAPYMRHFGKIEGSIFKILKGLYSDWGRENIKAIGFTGNHGKKISQLVHCPYEYETISQILGALFLGPDTRTIISMGGQDTALFLMNHHRQKGSSDRNAWELDSFNTNGPCASGTGSFIDQQAQRLATSIYNKEQDFSQDQIDNILSDFISLGLKSSSPAKVACRCTVFTKSDMIHLQNKGEKLEDIIYGLHVGNARNYMSTIVSNRKVEAPIILIGGLSLNRLQVRAFKTYFPELTVPEYCTSMGALGVALQSLENGYESHIDLEKETSILSIKECMDIPTAPRLELKYTTFSEENSIRVSVNEKDIPVYIGIDIGSTTTKYAVINDRKEIIHKDYVHTQGKPIEVTQRLLGGIQKEIGKRIIIKGVATTGSGRNVVGDFLNADLIIDEITAHARGAVEIDPSIDSVFEIGGQDSKYIFIENTHPLDFDMNKVCAAGTGSFLHELANKYGINIVNEFQEIALSSDSPVRLTERCTVFMESDLVAYQQKGVNQKDLIGGLCFAIAYNYLNRVVGKRKIGEKVMLLGGPSLNKGVVAAFENILGKEIIVPRHREVLGAYGAALRLKEKISRDRIETTSFRGLENVIKDRMNYQETICRADKNCHNQCKLMVYDFDGRKSIWGGECGRYELVGKKGPKKENYFSLRDSVFMKYLDGFYETAGKNPILEVDGRPTIGMQRALYAHHSSVLWAHFFDHLGFRLVLSPPTNSHIAEMGIESMTSEACFPVKVSHGHIKHLAGKTRYMFLPSIINVHTKNESETGFYCPFLQSNQYMVRIALDLDNRNIINPIIHLKYDPDLLTVELAEQLKGILGKSRKEISAALFYALEKQDSFIEELQKKGRETIEDHDHEEPLVIVTGRPYNLYDERLNLRLGQNLAKIGVSAIPMDFIDVSSIDLSDFPDMYWGLGAQILRTAKFIKKHDNYFGLHITNFSCGPDSFLEHFYKHVMSDKPYLILELDEHSAVAGVMTRLEAYQNVIENSMETMKNGLYRKLKYAN